MIIIIICRSEVSLWKNRCSLKNTNRNSKLRWEIRLETQIRNLPQQAKMIRKRTTMLGRKEKSNTTNKTNNSSRGNKLEGTGEGRKTKMISRQHKQYRQNRTFPINEKKILPASRRRMQQHIATSGWQGKKTILEQNMGTKRI